MHRTEGGKPLSSIIIALILGVLVLGLVGCGSGTTTTTAGVTTTAAETSTSTAAPTTTAAPQELTVSAASSLKAAFTDIAAAFDSANNAKTNLNFDASGTLQKQIEGGAPVDVFASAAMKQMNALLKGNLVDEASVKVFAGNEIVILVPADSTLAIASLEDLAKDQVKRVTYGDPAAAPHGVAAEEILTKLGLMDTVKPKVIYAANVSGALEYVTKGEVDAAIVFATEAKVGGDKVKVAATSDPTWHSEIRYPIGVVSASKNQNLAQAFVDFVMGDEGQKVLQSYGFLPAPTTEAAAASVATSGTITVKGKVDNPMQLTVESLRAMSPATITAEHPKQGEQQYSGVRLSDLMAALKVQPAAASLVMGASDGFMGEVTLADLAASPDAMIAIGDDGKLNGVMPGMSGKAWVRDIVSIEFR